MDSPQNFINAWMNTQSKIVDNLVDTSKKLQASFQKNELVEKSVEMYSNWFDNQKSMTDSMLHILKMQGNKPANSQDYFKKFVEAQIEFGKKWADLLTGKVSKPNNTPDILKYLENMQNFYADWTKMYSNMFAPNTTPQHQMFTFGQIPNLTEVNQMINNTRTYMKMFEMWQPIYKMIQSNSVGIDSLNKMLDMDKYREILSGIFQLMDKDKASNFLSMMQQFSEMTAKNLNMGNALPQMMSNLQQMFPNQMLDQNLGTLTQISQQFNEQFQKMIQPHFTTVPASREKEMARLTMEIQNRYTKYYVKTSELQNTIYVAGQKAMELAVQEVMQKAQRGGEAISFDEFYNTWVNIMEEEIISLFGGDTYSKLQGDLLKIGLEIKAHTDSLMEHILAPLPLVPRSEIDELNATIYELKNKVRSLEQQLSESKKESKQAMQ